MTETNKNFRHVALEQLKLMVDFMSQHPDFASGTLRTLEARHQSKQLWSELAKILNNRKGAKKTYIGWSRVDTRTYFIQFSWLYFVLQKSAHWQTTRRRYWSDWKNKLKKKVTERKKRKLSDKKDIKPYTKIEKQALAILEPVFERKKSRSDLCEPCDPLPIEIKQESMMETALLTNGHYKVIGLESESSAQSSDDEECVEDADQSSDEAILSNIYPKWLMKIEQKRADADLHRAKAEEQRADVSAKTAEAMLIQAEALKKLSEAAERQADAVLRIAMVMETRHPDDLNLIQSRHMSGYR